MKGRSMTITFPAGLAGRLRGRPNVSAFIAAAIREKLDREARVRAKTALAAAYRRAAQEERNLIREWDGVASDGL